MILACSGGSNVGQLSNQAAVELTQEGFGKMFCLAGIGGQLSGFVQSAKDVPVMVAIDGCQVGCAKAILELAQVPLRQYVVITDEGIEKNKDFNLQRADIDRVKYPTAAEKQAGLYAQANYHLLHDTFLKGSVVTLVVRGDWVDYDRDRSGEDEEGLTLGVNFRPTEETVFKFDYNWTWLTPLEGAKGDPTNRFFFSFATYF